MPQPFNNAVVTDAGTELLIKAQFGEAAIEFTKIAVGDGIYVEDEKGAKTLQQATGLKSMKNAFGISGITISSENSVKITALITNYNLITQEVLVSEGYYINEIGLYAREKGVEGTEILYSLAVSSGQHGDFLPGYDGYPAEIFHEYYVAASNTADITIQGNMDAPALADDLQVHTNDKGIHITEKERDVWNAKLDKTGDASGISAVFTQAESRDNITSGEKLSAVLGKIRKWFADLKAVAFTGSYLDLSDKLTIDGELSVVSENPVQNKAVTEALDDKLSKTETAASASKWSFPSNINGISIDGTADRTNYGICSTSASTAAKTVTCNGFGLVTGAEITVKFTDTNTASNPTLNVNSLGEKPIYYRGSAISPSYLGANRTYTFRYNGAQWDFVGDINVNTDTNTWKANTASSEGYVAKGSGNANKVWKTDANGNPAWRDDTNTVYTHPTTPGNKHIPSGGSSGQILRWSSDGAAAWGNENTATYSDATTTAHGLMTAADKVKLDGIAAGAQANSITGVKGDAETSYRTGEVNLTPENIGAAKSSIYGDTVVSVGRRAETTVGEKSFAFGYDVAAIGNYSHAEGWMTRAAGNYSHAEGWQAAAIGDFSHAEGDRAKASEYSHAEGAQTTASGTCSHAEGDRCTASGGDAHAEGQATEATGQDSHSEGGHTKASGYDSHAEGRMTKANNYASHASGKYNKTMTSGGDDNTQIGDVFVIGNGTALYTGLSNALRVTYQGDIYGTKAFQSSGADYAEFIKPWADGNPDGEDRIGYFVTVKNGLLEKANEGDYIVGITSGNPSIVGNADEDYYWRYERDEFNRIVMEDVPELVQQTDEEGNPVFDEETHEPVMEETGNIIKNARMKLSEDYDSELQNTYIERKDRKEWDYVGMLGVLPVRDDGTCIPGQFCKCKDGGIATLAEHRGVDTYMVLERISENVVSVILK